jgi:nicotinamide-nucleotide amidase
LLEVLRTNRRGAWIMNTDPLARAVGELLQQRHLTLAVAESCTGGLLATYITNIPGSSAYFEGGVVAYSNDVKERVLNVPPDVLEEYGAVSPETAIAMAKGVRQLLQVDLALAVSGIAGPTGGTAEKPVGLVYVALTSDQGEECRRYLWAGDRWENREWSARAALELLHEHLTAPSPRPDPGEDVPPSVERTKDARGMQVEVDARFEKPGHPVPLAFKWQGQWLLVASVGRTWSTGQGEKLVHHYMVSTPGEAVFELTFEPATMRWRVVRGGTKHMVA